MASNITRRDLYELVWSRPRSEIAKEFGISGVRLGKICREMNVPAPPRGYWANLAGKRKRRKFARPPLPYSVAERIEEDHTAVRASLADFDPQRLEQPIPPPPVFPCSAEEALERYRVLIDATPIPHVSRGLHPITQKFVLEDDRLAELARKSSWYKPKFATPEGKELLEGLNRLLWFFVDLGVTPRSSGYRDIVMRVGCGGHWRTFEITIAERGLGRAREAKRRSATFEFRFDTDRWERRSEKPAVAFSHFNRNVLRSIAKLVFAGWEDDFRASVKHHYEWNVSERKRTIAQIELAQQHKRQREAAEVKALLDGRKSLLADALRHAGKSQAIRLLVEALGQRLEALPHATSEFRRWRAWALAQADAIDPTMWSPGRLDDWIREFHLDGDRVEE